MKEEIKKQVEFCQDNHYVCNILLCGDCIDILIKKAKEEVLDYFVDIYMITPKEAEEIMKKLKSQCDRNVQKGER